MEQEFHWNFRVNLRWFLAFLLRPIRLNHAHLGMVLEMSSAPPSQIRCQRRW